MTGFHKERYAVVYAAAAILAAVIARVLSKLGILPIELGLIRTTLYIVLYIMWGISLQMRIVHTPVRRYLTAVATLMVFWFVLRTIKYFFSVDAFLSRWLWYSYYIPILFIPLFALYVSMALGTPVSYRLPKWAAVFAVITALAAALVLTNDLHRLVFAFPQGEVWSDKNGEYTVGYYIIFGWGILCALTSFVIMEHKCRVSRRKKYLPVILIALSLAYACVYATGAEWLHFIAGDVTAVQCLFYAAIFESCIYCGLIQTNTGYDSLFEACTLKMQIADRTNRICYASAKAQPLSGELIQRAEQGPVLLDNNTLVKAGKIEGGHVIWQEDITELIAVIERLEENRRELYERNYLEQETYNTKRRIISLREKNRLFDIFQRQTAPQIALLDDVFAQYDREPDPEKRRRLLAESAVVGAYLKRYGNLLFVGEKNDVVEFGELSRCIGESFANLELLGVTCGCAAQIDETVRTQDALRAYRTLENVIEASLGDLRFLWLKARSFTEHIMLYIEAECSADLSALSQEADGYTAEDGVHRFALRLGKGGASV
ncbi:MAG: hypothetical protein ACI4Q4_07110 [Oscillospiraceae bacterium]